SLLLLSMFVVVPVGASLWAQEQAPPVGTPSAIRPSPPAVAPDAPPVLPPAAQPTRPIPARPVPAADTTQFAPQVIFSGVTPQRAARFQISIAPDTPVKELLPAAPVAKKSGSPLHAQSLAEIPEVDFQAPLAKALASAEAQKQTAHMIAKVNHVN